MEIVDINKFEKQTMGNLDTQIEFLELSSEVFKGYHSELQKSAETNDLEKLKNIVHKAKTGAFLLGMTKLHSMYENIENNLKNKNILNFSTLIVEDLIESFNLAFEKLQNYINSKN